MAARDLYDTLWKEIHAEIMALNGLVGSYTSAINTLVDKADNLTTTNAALTEEIKAFGELYKGYAEAYSAYNYSFNTTPGTKSYVNAFSKSDYLATSGNHITNNTAKVGTNAVNYLGNGVKDDLDEYLEIFKATFGATAAENTIIDLWTYKTDMIAALNAIKASYKNEYKSSQKVVEGYLQTVIEKTASTRFVYDATETEKSSTKGVAYEAQVDALFDSYIAKIEAVTLSSVAQVKDVQDKEILKKWDKKTYDLDGDDAFAANETIEKVVFNIAAAQELIDAYVVDLVGYEVATELGISNEETAVEDLTGNAGYDLKAGSGMGRIEKAWNVYYNGIYN
jgi:hypothetical protein